jgi:hypothetical protein
MQLFRLALACALVGSFLAVPDARADEPRERAGSAPVAKPARPYALKGITWHRGAQAALASTVKASKPKPVFLVRMLGELDEKT